MPTDEFTRFEHEGWERVAHKFDSVWASLTRQFIPYLIEAAQIAPQMSILDVACGPGYVSAAVKKLGANPTGVDFSKEMVSIARRLSPGIQFVEGDAQQLPFAESEFDRVLMNFGLLHLSQPEQACKEACRVLRPRGRLAFTVWAEPAENPGMKIVEDAIERYGDTAVEVPEGPRHFLFSGIEECRRVLARSGFDGQSLLFQTRLVEWTVPTARFFFEAERDAGVRTAGVLAKQPPEKLEAIGQAIEQRVRRYPRGDAFAIPMAAHVIAVAKK